jgi:hypothetical protein
MNAEKKIILEKIDSLISKSKIKLLKELPSIHEITDGFIVRFFTEWDNCEDNVDIKYKKIINKNNPNESNVFFFIPQNSYFQLKQRFYVGSLMCLNGKLEIDFDGMTYILNNYSKLEINSDELEGKALENTYVVTTSNRLDWSNHIHKYAKTNY